MKNRYDLILFDLDGTLIDTSNGIFNSVRYTEKQMGFDPIPDSKLKEFVGPPPKMMYQSTYSIDEQTALKAAKYHREYGREKAIYEATVYTGIVQLLETLKNKGFMLGVATLKSQSIAERILMIHGLFQLFDCIVGMDTDESLTKQDIIKIAMKRMNSRRTLLIGDSQYDYDGAVKAGVDFIGVLYGFGFKDKSEEYPTIERPQELFENI